MSDAADLILKRLSAHLEPHGAVSEFSRKTGIPRKNLDNWLSGTAIPLDAVGPIARGLGCEPWELLKPPGAQPTPTRDSLLGQIVGRLAGLNEKELGAYLGLIDRARDIASVQDLAKSQHDGDLRRKS